MLKVNDTQRIMQMLVTRKLKYCATMRQSRPGQGT